MDPEKEQRLHAALAPWFKQVATHAVEFRLELPRERAVDLVAMTPSARHLDPARVGEVAQLPEQVTVSVLVTCYRPL